MKYFLLALLTFFLISTVASAEEWVITNQKTVGWDEVTQDINGTPFSETTEIRYRVFTRLVGNTEVVEKTTEPIKPVEGAGPSFTITMSVEGQHHIGVSSSRFEKIDDVYIEVGKSDISWSDNPEVVFEGKTFGIQFFAPPAKPKEMSK